jgi:Lhr-like helicase
MTLQFNQLVADLWPDFQEAMTALGIVGLRSVQYDVLNTIAKAHDLVVVCPSGHGKTTAALLTAALTMSKAGGCIASCMVMVVESEREVKRIIS